MFVVSDHFPMISFEAWKEGVEKDLGTRGYAALTSHTEDNIAVPPLAPRRADRAFVQAAGRRRLAIRTPAELAPNDAPRTLIVVGDHSAEAYRRFAELGNVEAIHRESAAQDPASASELHQMLAATNAEQGHLGVDPFAAIRSGTEPKAALLDCAQRLLDAESLPKDIGVVSIDARFVREAGGTPGLMVGYALSAMIDCARAVDRAGSDLDALFARTTVALSLGPDFFVELAALRALRKCWAGVAHHLGTRAEAPRIRTDTLEAALSQLDASVNMLRATSAAAAAFVGGAEWIVTAPYDAPLSDPSAIGMRAARNTHLILEQEAALAEVTDAAAGSEHIETLTDRLAEEAWEVMQILEKEGGAAGAISGLLGPLLLPANAVRKDALSRRGRKMVGVNMFADVSEAPPSSVPSVTEAGLDPVRYAAPFEQLRARASGLESRVFVACLGPLLSHKRAVDETRAFLALAGIRCTEPTRFESPESAAAAFAESGSVIAAAAFHSQHDGTEVKTLVDALTQGGAKQIFHAQPHEALADSGAVRLEPSSDTVELLENTLRLMRGEA